MVVGAHAIVVGVVAGVAVDFDGQHPPEGPPTVPWLGRLPACIRPGRTPPDLR